MTRRQIPRLVVGLALVALTLTACSSGSDSGNSDDSTPKVGGTLNVGVPEDFDSLDPHGARGETSSTWEALVYETLVGVTKTADPAPGIAKSWKISEDGLTYSFVLNDATFSNGDPVTSKDIVWNYEHIADPKSGASQQAFFSQITKMDTPDDKNLVLTLAAPNASFLSVLGIQGRAGIQSPKNFEGGKMVANIGSGPYTWKSYKANDRLVLKRNADYWKDPAFIEEIQVRILPDDNARLQALSSGELDLAWGMDAAQATQSAKDGAFKVQEDAQNRGNYFAINVTKAPFDNLKLRQAMQLAISREDIAAAGWDGFADPTNQPFAVNSPWYDKSDFPVKADLAKAKSLVAAAGAEGTKVNMLVWDALGSDQEAQIVASAWTEIGLKPTIEKVDIGKIVTDSTAGKFDVVYLWIGLITDPSRPYAYFDQANANNGLIGQLKDAALSKKVNEALATADLAKRKALYSEILAENYAQAATYYTVNPKALVGVGPRLVGYEQGTYNVVYENGGLTKAYLKGD